MWLSLKVLLAPSSETCVQDLLTLAHGLRGNIGQLCVRQVCNEMLDFSDPVWLLLIDLSPSQKPVGMCGPHTLFATVDPFHATHRYKYQMFPLPPQTNKIISEVLHKSELMPVLTNSWWQNTVQVR